MIEAESFVENALAAGKAAFPRYREVLPRIPGGYSRTLLKKTGDYELIAMLWSPGCRSPIHDHADSRCWVLVLEGTIEVANFARVDDGGECARILPADRLHLSQDARDQRLTWRELHYVRNSENTPAFTLQVYAPQLAVYHVVDEASGIVRTVPGVYDAIFDI